MKLNQKFTKPAIRSMLSFTEEELIDALQEYAKQRGYSFTKNSAYKVWHPEKTRGERLTELVIDIDGSVGAILKGAKECLI